MLKIGVSYENTTDLLVMQQLLDRLCIDGKDYEIVVSMPCRTGIIGSVKAHTVIFFNIHKVDLAIFLTDQDVPTEKDDRFVKIVNTIESVDPVYILSSVVAVCNPHIEQWLVVDHNAVKKVFNLDPTKPLPSAQSPKMLIEKARNLQDEQLSKHDSYLALAKTVDIDIIKKSCPEFRDFCESISSKSQGHF